jgi:hypothetical protein
MQQERVRDAQGKEEEAEVRVERRVVGDLDVLADPLCKRYGCRVSGRSLECKSKVPSEVKTTIMSMFVATHASTTFVRLLRSRS